jgi:hypothetical protein
MIVELDAFARGCHTGAKSPHNATQSLTRENMNKKGQTRIRQADIVVALRAAFFLVRNEPELRAVVLVFP